MRHQRIPCMTHVLHICKIQLCFYIFVIHFCKTHILDTEDNERGDAVDATARHTLCCIATPKARDSMHPDWDPKKAQIRYGAGGWVATASGLSCSNRPGLRRTETGPYKTTVQRTTGGDPRLLTGKIS